MMFIFFCLAMFNIIRKIDNCTIPLLKPALRFEEL